MVYCLFEQSSIILNETAHTLGLLALVKMQMLLKLNENSYKIFANLMYETILICKKKASIVVKTSVYQNIFISLAVLDVVFQTKCNNNSLASVPNLLYANNYWNKKKAISFNGITCVILIFSSHTTTRTIFFIIIMGSKICLSLQLLLSRTTTLFGMTILPAVPESKQRYAAFIISMSTLHAIQALFSLRTCFEQIKKTFLFLKLFLSKKWFGKESNINNNEGNISTWNTQTLTFTSNIESDTICFVYGCVVRYENSKL